MASIRKLKSGNYQVQIRLLGLRPIVRSFSTKKKSQEFARQVEGDSEFDFRESAVYSSYTALESWYLLTTPSDNCFRCCPTKSITIIDITIPLNMVALTSNTPPSTPSPSNNP